MILTISIWFDVTKCNFNLNLSVFRHLDELRTNLSLSCMSSTQLLLDTILPEHSSSQEWNREALEFLDSFLNSENTTSLLETTVATPEDSSVGLAETIAELSNDSRILDGKIVSTLSTETNLSLLVNSCNVFNDSVAKFSSLLESTRKQVELIEEHSTISTVNLKKLSIPQTQNIAPLLYNFSDMVLLLEIPALTKLLIAKSQFADCIQLSSISKNLQIRYHKLPLVNSIQENTSLQISDMVKKLSGLLLSNIKQSSMIKILSHLKKVIPDNDHLKSIFLHLRFAFIMDELDTLTPLLNSRLYEKYLKRVLEVFREFCFQTLITFHSFFDSDRQLMHSFISSLATKLCGIITENIKHISDPSTRDSLLLQLIYCSSSLSRLGGDFTQTLLCMLPPAVDKQTLFTIIHKQKTLTNRL